jgi:hypothetical protein
MAEQGLPSKDVLEQLLKTSVTWLGERDEAIVLNRILQGVQALGFDRARLYLLSEDGEMLIAKAHIGMGERFLQARRLAKMVFSPLKWISVVDGGLTSQKN